MRTKPPRSLPWLLGVTLLLVLAWDAAGGDRTLSAWLGGRTGFPLRAEHSWATVAHATGRWLSAAVLTLQAVDAAWRQPPWRRPGRGPTVAARRWTLAFTLLALVAVPALKQFSATSCPWDLAEFGGTVPWVSHWAWRLVDGGPGHCFPSGHAVAAWAFSVPALACRHHHPRGSRLALWAVTVMGFLFGAVQMLRGAHYLSHVLWSAWLCLALGVVATLVAMGFERHAARRSSPTSSTCPQPQRSLA